MTTGPPDRHAPSAPSRPTAPSASVPAVAGEPTDEALLAAHVAGDPDAFGVLVRRHGDRLWAVALRTTRDREEAADALQDALVSAVRSADRFRGDARVSTWLHRIVVNACLDRLRRRAVRPVPTADEPLAAASDDAARTGRTPAPADPADAAVADDRRSRLEAALRSLPVEQRLALVLVDVQGLGVAEAAAVLEVAEGTVKSRRARARVRLATLLADLAPRNPGAPPDVGGQADGAGAAGEGGGRTEADR